MPGGILREWGFGAEALLQQCSDNKELAQYEFN